MFFPVGVFRYVYLADTSGACYFIDGMLFTKLQDFSAMCAHLKGLVNPEAGRIPAATQGDGGNDANDPSNEDADDSIGDDDAGDDAGASGYDAAAQGGGGGDVDDGSGVDPAAQDGDSGANKAGASGETAFDNGYNEFKISLCVSSSLV